MIGAPVSDAFVADLAPEHLRGRYQGLYGLTWATGTVTGPAIGVWLFAQSPTALWATCGLVAAVSAVLVLGTRRRAAPSVPSPAIPRATMAEPVPRP